MSRLIDRRQNGKNKSAVNRRRFLNRYKSQIKAAVAKAIGEKSITDIHSGEKIIISKKELDEPIFHHGIGGKREQVYPGNREFQAGDKLKKPLSQSRKDTQASDTGECEDDFVFELSRDEFWDLYFDDLALPDLVRKDFSSVIEKKYTRAGYQLTGTPTNLNIVRSIKQATGRRLSLKGAYKEKIKALEQEIKVLKKNKNEKESNQIALKEEEIKTLKSKIEIIPFLDDLDLRYNNRVKKLIPTTQAVMFCIMDVSGSMDEAKKLIAKKFFIFLFLFLKKNYEKIQLIFIRHHTAAKEVDEHDFFYSRETGGTVVSSALELAAHIISERFHKENWNIYIAQASDGDNWNADSPYCEKILAEKIMPSVQFFYYIEIMARHHQSLWNAYLNIEKNFKNFSMRTVENAMQIYPVFRELFKRKSP